MLTSVTEGIGLIEASPSPVVLAVSFSVCCISFEVCWRNQMEHAPEGQCQ